jgi:hypothetical protein
MVSIAIRRMLSTPSPLAPLLVLLLPSLWAAPPKPIVVPLCHLVDRRLSPTLAPPTVSSLLTALVTPLRPSLARLGFLLISLLAPHVGSLPLSPWVIPPKPKTALQQQCHSRYINSSTSTSSCVGKTCWTTLCSHVTGHHRSNHLS